MRFAFRLHPLSFMYARRFSSQLPPVVVISSACYFHVTDSSKLIMTISSSFHLRLRVFVGVRLRLRRVSFTAVSLS